ncbi:MAG: head-tail connector protein [Desulfobacteraceae bacterium]|nr:head-tail connector protein [Desulfobacteraceae bacterium]
MANEFDNELKKFLEQENHFNASIAPTLKDIRDYILPRRGVFAQDGEPDQKTNIYSKRVNDAATKANRTAGAGLQGGLSSEAQDWFRITITDKELAKFAPVKTYLKAVEDAYYSVFSRSNFYGQIHKCYEDQAGFGTCPLLITPDFERVVDFRVIPCGQYYIANGHGGIVDVLYRYKWMQAQEIIRMFGDATTHHIKRMAENNPFHYFKIIHMVEPRLDRDRTKIDQVNMKYRSLWLDPGDTTQALRDSGFPYFPGVVPRWDVVGDSAYGNGPGHDALGQTKSLQEYEKTYIMSIHKEVNPPMAAPPGYKNVVDLRPGKVNYGLNGGEMKSLYEQRLRLADLETKVAQTEASIRATYFNDLFLLLSTSTGTDTAFEVAKKHEEKLQLLGPTIQRQKSEALNPIFDIVYEIMADRPGFLPEPPPELIGVDFKIEFISLLARAQQQVDVGAISEQLNVIERVNNLGPAGQKAVIATTDFDELLRQNARAVATPDKVVRSEEQTDAILAEMAAAEAEEQQQQQILNAAEAAKNLGGASTAEGTALGDMVNAAQQ